MTENLNLIKLKNYISLFIILVSAVYSNGQCPSTVSDVDGNSYPVVQIGSQCWMAENLKTNHYNDLSSIPDSLSQSQWSSTTQGAIGLSSPLYGNYYNFYTVIDPRGLCPAGWHVPSDSEFVICIDVLGGGLIAGGAMKETGTTHWISPNSGATNSSGLTALPGGYVTNTNMILSSENTTSKWWTSTVTQYTGSNPSQVSYIMLTSSNAFASHATADPGYGYSVRCISDNTTGMRDDEMKSPFVISPNPCSNKFMINSSINGKSIRVKMIDYSGKVVYQSILEGFSSTVNLPATISNGIYIVSFEDSNGVSISNTKISVLR